MPYFDKVNTNFRDQGRLIKALKNLGFRPEKGGALRGYAESHTQAELRFRPMPDSYHIGFRKRGGRYVCVADWFGVRGVQLQKFMETLAQEYDRVALDGADLCRAAESRLSVTRRLAQTTDE